MTDEKYLAKEQEFSALIKASSTEALAGFLRENSDIVEKLRTKTEIYVSLATMLPNMSVLAILLENEFTPKENKLALTSVIKKGRYDVLHLIKQYTDYTFAEEIEDGIKKYIKDTAPKKEIIKSAKKPETKKEPKPVNTVNDGLLESVVSVESVIAHIAVDEDEDDDFFSKKTKGKTLPKETEITEVLPPIIIEESPKDELEDLVDGGFTMLSYEGKGSEEPINKKTKETVISEFKSSFEHLNSDIIKDLKAKILSLENELIRNKASKNSNDGDIESKLQSYEADIFRLKGELKDANQATSYYKEEYSKLEKSFEEKVNEIKEELVISTSVWEDIVSHQEIEEYMSKTAFVERAAYGTPLELTELYNSSTVNEQDKFYALLAAISYARYENVLAMIYSFNTNINLESTSALVKAVNTGNDLIVGLLVQNGANIALGKYQILEHYILKNNIKMVTLLLKNNAIPFDETNRFLMAAVDSGYTDIAKLLILNKAPFLYRDGQIIEEIAKNRDLMSFIQVNF